MQVAGLLLRALDRRGDAYLPYEFYGTWHAPDKELVRSTMDCFVAERVDAMFNEWHFWHHEGGLFTARRGTWAMGCLSAHTAEELTLQLVDYYNSI